MEKNILTKEVAITLRGRQVMAKFPNIGQSLKIEQMKQILTDGRYAIMAFSGLKTTNQILDLVDSICYLSNVVDDFYGVLGVKGHGDILNMDLNDGIPKQLLDQYQNVYEPFYTERYARTDRPLKQAKNVVEVKPEDVVEEVDDTKESSSPESPQAELFSEQS